jgi:L-arabinokinase
MDKKILFYISGHGFGHSCRIIEVIKVLHKLEPAVFPIIKTSAPLWLFEMNLKTPYRYFCQVNDIGVIQDDGLHLNKRSTLEKWKLFLAQKDQLITGEVRFIKQEDISLVVGDIPPLAFDIANQANIPGLAISNFSWDWILKPYVREYPQYHQILSALEIAYSRAHSLLRLPFYGDMSCFKRIVDLPLIARRSLSDPQEIKERLGILSKKDRKIVLISFGGLGFTEIDFCRIKKLREYIFIGTGPVTQSYDNVIILPPELLRTEEILYEDLVNAADLVVTKPGYGIVSECIANRTPMLYTSRGDFAEYPVLVREMSSYIPSLFIPQEDLRNGNWKPYLERLLETAIPAETPPIDGATRAAQYIIGSTQK